MLTFETHGNVNSEECLHTRFSDGTHFIVEVAKYSFAPVSLRDTENYWMQRVYEEGVGYDQGMYMSSMSKEIRIERRNFAYTIVEALQNLCKDEAIALEIGGFEYMIEEPHLFKAFVDKKESYAVTVTATVNFGDKDVQTRLLLTLHVAATLINTSKSVEFGTMKPVKVD